VPPGTRGKPETKAEGHETADEREIKRLASYRALLRYSTWLNVCAVLSVLAAIFVFVLAAFEGRDELARTMMFASLRLGLTALILAAGAAMLRAMVDMRGAQERIAEALRDIHDILAAEPSDNA
jgi:H+/gluconate symporter-like permease